MITISVGITLVIENDTAKCIFERFDLFMYQSKKNGKNLVTFD